MVLETAKRIKTIPVIKIECFHDYPTAEASSAFIFYSNVKVHMNFRVRVSVFCIIISRKGNFKSHAVPAHEIITSWCPVKLFGTIKKVYM